MIQCARVEGESRIASSILDKLRELQVNDQQCQQVMRNKASDESELRVEKNLVLNGDKYLVPKNREFQNELLKLYHDNSGHFGVQKTYELINRLFSWKKLYDDVQLYVKQCTQCQRNKPSNKKPQGLLVPLPVPNQAWNSIAMDFITNLPKSKDYGCLLTVMDRLTKMVHLIPTHSNATAKDIAALFIKEIVRIHGLPAST